MAVTSNINFEIGAALLITIVDELGLTHSNEIHSGGGSSTSHACFQRASDPSPLGLFIRGAHHYVHKDLKAVVVCGRNRSAREIAFALQDARIVLHYHLVHNMMKNNFTSYITCKKSLRVVSPSPLKCLLLTVCLSVEEHLLIA